MLPVSLTGFTGYFIYSPVISSGILLVTVGIFLVAVSATVLNQVQEKDIDSRMNRTRLRPIPSGNIKISAALLFFVVALIAGMVILYKAGNVKSAAIALFALVWYNGVYTPLKRISAFAVIPGALAGALPPLIGWVAAGGDIVGKTVTFLELLLFIGQIPHFWLLMLKYGEEYKDAGMPVLTGLFGHKKVSGIISTLVIVTAFSATVYGYFEIFSNGMLQLVLCLSSAAVIWQFSRLGKTNAENPVPAIYSGLLDAYFLLIMLLLISNRIIS